MSDKHHAHFEGKDALSHVVEARLKGKKAFSEMHGKDIPSHLFFASESIKETSIVFLSLWIIFSTIAPSYWINSLIIFGVCWIVLKTAQVAYIGWSRLERLHNLIEEERWEIEHHRQQEKEELTALYEAKGFSGKLLEQVIDILMSDDHRLLQIMLEEELGLTLKAFEHPLKQCFGAFLGTVIALTGLAVGFVIWPSYGIALAATMLVTLCVAYIAKKEKRAIWPAVMYGGGIAALCSLTAYFLKKLIV